MILSMALQAVYNIVDSAFCRKYESGSEEALNALTLVFQYRCLWYNGNQNQCLGTNASSKDLGQETVKKLQR